MDTRVKPAYDDPLCKALSARRPDKMQWRDSGIVLRARRHGERALLLHVLTQEHGRHAGLLRNGQSAKQRGWYEPGNELDIAWRARLAEHLGTFRAELQRSHAARFLDDPPRLAALAAAAALADAVLPEHEPHPRAYRGLLELIAALEEGRGWAGRYVRWELDLLAELGFGLDLASCAATGRNDNLIYVSPRSGQAVSASAGEPYRDKLLLLPPFLIAEGTPTQADLADGLTLTGFFLERRVAQPHDRKLPAARARFVDAIRRMATISGRNFP
jgi:DNA repair protein RecO (recombination protein O)